MRVGLALLAAAAAVASAGCGGSGGGAEAAPGEPPPPLPACAGASAGVEPPPGFPDDFPLPPGTVPISADSPFEGQLVLVAAIPADLQEAAIFFNAALPKSGYRIGIGDAEGTESEAPFTGNGFRGKWRVNGIPGCDAVKLTLVLIDQP